MERGFRKPEDPNCQCQCHFPSNVVCQMTQCCHCVCDYDSPIQGMSNNTSINFSPNIDRSTYNNRNLFASNSNLGNFKYKKPRDLNMMNSISTNYKSGNDSMNMQNSGINSFNNTGKNYYSLRKIQNQGLQQNNLLRNFSDPKFNINNDNSQINNYSNNNQQESYRNNNDSFYKNSNNYFNNNYINNPNNSINMTEPNYPSSQLNSPNNNNSIYNNNLTYMYKENLTSPNENINRRNLINGDNNNLQNGKLDNNMINNKYINPLDLTYLSHNNNIDQLKSDLVKAHDFISILQRENDYLKSQRDDAMNQISANENIKNVDRVKCDELQNENNELRKRLNDEMKKNKQKDNYISDLKEELNNLKNIIHDKDHKIQDLILNMRKLEQDANNEINKLKNKIDDLNRQKEALIRDFQKEINDLNDELRQMNNLLEDEKRKSKELENKIKTMKRFDDKKEKLLETLFNWFNTMNKLLNTNTATGKMPPKEILNDVLNLQTVDEFKDKLNQIEEKLSQFIEDMKLKFGECFACDIACCTSEVDRLKYFRKYYPGPPKDYLEGKKKCKCV